ncbi:hypothetical protein GCM10010922_15190 [Microbacterium sorbitolivorans]|uniref:DUF3060 domain-containing protein n=1 Tax=Microbacterium sorbitolivorans TaxID=1867410 RepID=A0A367Y4B4_9MICO|nr:DUF3060 domain-containing protein [Microbacterium sorbitolivorans]RCK59872.1 DUF3060 domain-containing protein [Microbacterium sorbitolivorans]GGF40738.1 hypothetical protein GCM10010922_15190 [Microbacterium sorbitolivorans]
MRVLSALALSAVLIAGLTGCSVSVSEPDDEQTSTDNASSDASENTSENGSATEPAGEAGEPAETVTEDPETEESTPTSNDEAGADSDAVATAWSEEEAAYRESMLDVVTRTLTCDGELVFGQNEPGQIVQIDGPCDHVVVHMDAGVVVAGEVGTIDVTGAGNVIYLDGAETINVGGDANSISWLGATPKVTDTGAGNVVISGS